MRTDAVVRSALVALLMSGLVACGASPDAAPAESGGSAGSGGNIASAGKGGTAGTAAGTAGSAGSGSGGSSSSAGSSSTGGTGGGQGGPDLETTPGVWQNVSPNSSNTNAVVVNRLTGEVLADVDQGGIWKSSDYGANWSHVDGGTVSGLVVMGPGFDVDQDDPSRVAAWSLDGDAGWLPDGATWKKMAPMGRNWDFGATDWATPEPKTMIATLHESSGAVYLSTDGSASFSKMSITVLASGAGWPPPAYAMVGVMDATTLIYGDGDGILRSTDTGATWNKVSDLNVQTRVPVLFQGVFYLGGEDGLIVSTDKGASWQTQGSSLVMWVGPYFGADASSMMVANNEGVFTTADAGTTWSKVASLPSDAKYQPQVFGSYAWDQSQGVIYAAATGVPLMRMKL